MPRRSQGNRLCSRHEGAGNEDMVFGKREAEVMEVEDCREPPGEGGRLMGVNQGTAEVRWNLWFFLC